MMGAAVGQPRRAGTWNLKRGSDFEDRAAFQERLDGGAAARSSGQGVTKERTESARKKASKTSPFQKPSSM